MRDCVQTDSAVSFLQSEVLAVAAQQLKQKLLDLAAPVLGSRPDQLKSATGRITRAPERSISVKELLWKGDLVPLSVMVSRPPVASRGRACPISPASPRWRWTRAPAGSQVLKLVILNDCGTVMYASGAEAQQIGGQVHGHGRGADRGDDLRPGATGVPLNFNFIDYKMPTMPGYARRSSRCSWKYGGAQANMGPATWCPCR